MLEDSAWITLPFTLLVFRTKQGAWHKQIQLNYKLSSTYPRLAIFSLWELHQTSPSALMAETSFRYQSDPPENQTCHTDEGGASLACYQSTLISVTSFFSQLYFACKVQMKFYERSLQALFSSAPRGFAARSLARSHETRFTRPNRRACSEATGPEEMCSRSWLRWTWRSPGT